MDRTGHRMVREALAHDAAPAKVSSITEVPAIADALAEDPGPALTEEERLYAARQDQMVRSLDADLERIRRDLAKALDDVRHLGTDEVYAVEYAEAPGQDIVRHLEAAEVALRDATAHHTIAMRAHFGRV